MAEIIKLESEKVGQDLIRAIAEASEEALIEALQEATNQKI